MSFDASRRGSTAHRRSGRKCQPRLRLERLDLAGRRKLRHRASFRGDAEAVLMPEDEARFDTVTYTYYQQLNGYKYLKSLHIGYHFYANSYVDDILKALNPAEKTIGHIPNVNSRESTKDKFK
ncbi:hypothetical protein ABIE28_000037 [Devosia sp. 2618]